MFFPISDPVSLILISRFFGIYFSLFCLYSWTSRDIASSHGFFSEDPDITRNVSEIIISRGYPCEEHYVSTKDGFVLNLQRIPHGRKASRHHRTLPHPPEGTKPVVFLQHGILADATNWIIDFPSLSLGYILADNGFDVWLGNVRGNDYSRRNSRFDPSKEEFWDWSWQEMADIDLPAMINYVLKQTSLPQLFYIGHSQGTLMGFSGFADNTTLAKQIKLFIALAPVYTLDNCTKIAKDGAEVVYPLIKKYFSNFNFEFIAGDFIRWLVDIGLCKGHMGEKLCYDALETVVGFDSKNINESRVPVYIAHFFEGTSFKDVVHFAQMIYSGKCQKFDYGKTENIKRYNQTSPPLCHVQDMPTPTALFYGKKDGLADPADVLSLKPKIKNLVHIEEIKEWNHLDFLYGVDAAKILYPKIVQLLEDRLD